MRKLLLIFALLVFLGIVFVVVVGIGRKAPLPESEPALPPASISPSVLPTASPQGFFPIEAKSIIYIFQGLIERTIDTAEGLQLILAAPDQSELPPFIVTESIQVLKIENNKRVIVPRNNLSANVPIRINAVYNILRSNWELAEVHILDNPQIGFSPLPKRNNLPAFPKPPVSLESPSVATAEIVYTFLGTVLQVESLTEGSMLTLDVAEKIGLSPFRITEKTVVQKIARDGSSVTTSLSDISIETRVQVLAYYNAARDLWETKSVTLQP